MIADIPGTMCDKDGNELNQGTLKNVNLLPTGKFNLFSLSKMLRLGWKMGGDDTEIWHKSGDKKISFDIIIPTPKGSLYVMYMKRTGAINNEKANASIDKWSIKTAHERLGHCSEDTTCKTAKALGLELTRGTLPLCAACAAGKAKQKNAPTKSDHVRSNDPYGRIYFDIATAKKIKDRPKVSKPKWQIMADEKTNLKFSDFHQTKNGMVEPTCEQLNKWKQAGRPVKFIWLDNAGENKLLLETYAESMAWKFDIQFEFTARDTPQQNHYAEFGFTVLANKGRAFMHRANIPLLMRYKIWREAFKTVTLLDGLIPCGN